MDENKKKIDDEMNNMNLGPNNENQDNPYYNPYFQNTDLNSSPYFTDSNINLNNDIYTNPEPITTNTDQSNVQDNTNQDKDVSIPDFNNDNIQNNNVDTPIQENNVNDDMDDSSVNLFNLAQEETDNLEPPIENTNTQFEEDTSDIQPQNFNVQQPEEPSNFQTPNFNVQQLENSSNFQMENFNAQPEQVFSNYQQVNDPFNASNYQQPADSTYSYNAQQNNVGFDNNDYIQPDNQMYGSDNDEEFRRVWMGKLYDKATTKKFNWSAFFFGGFYFFYRKLYLWGFLFFILSVLPLINNIICGLSFYSLYKSHINKTLEQNKNNVQSPNQLLDIAKAKGGTSAGSAIIAGLLLFVVPVAIVAISLVNIFLIGNNVDTPSQGNTNTNIGSNLTSETPVEENEYYNFYNDYNIEYNPANWQVDSDGDGLVRGNYNFGFMQSIEDLASFGYDVSTDAGRSSFFTFLYNQFSSQIDASTTLELGSSNFSSLGNGLYYSYIDLIYATSMERCYFVLIPEDNIFVEFILSNQDTVIAEEVHTEIVNNLSTITVLDDTILMMSNTVGENSVVEIDTNTIANSLGNAVSENMVAEPSQITIY